jgi:hypothetical protein
MKIEGTTCFNEHDKRGLSCEKRSCRLWMDSAKDLNCCALAANRGEHTLQEIGDIFGITRMRVCQIEKNLLIKMEKDSHLGQAV